MFLWFPIHCHPKPSIAEKRKNKAKYLTWNAIRLKFWRRPACQTLSKALDISSATAQVAPDLLKALEFLSDTTVRRSAVDREDLKPNWNWALARKLKLMAFSQNWEIRLAFTIGRYHSWQQDKSPRRNNFFFAYHKRDWDIK